MAISIDNLGAEIAVAWKAALSEGWDQLNSFYKSQTSKISKQAALIAKLRLEGDLVDDDEMFAFLLDQLEDNVRNFANAVANLTMLTLQKAWNASVGVLWGAINKLLTGAGFAALPIPALK